MAATLHKAMKILSIEEKEDGSANLQVELSTEEVQYLIQEGMIAVLRRTMSTRQQFYDAFESEESND